VEDDAELQLPNLRSAGRIFANFDSFLVMLWIMEAGVLPLLGGLGPFFCVDTKVKVRES